MKKKLTSILLILALVLTMMPVATMTSWAATSFDGIQWDIKDGVLTISKGTATDKFAAGEMGVMESYDYKGWGSRKNEITKVVIEEGVKNISASACSNMPNLQSVVIASSVEQLDTYAFSGCQNLQSVTLKSGIKEIGDYAFYGCSNLTDITFPDSVKRVGSDALTGTAFLEAQAENDFVICGKILVKTNCTDFIAAYEHPCVIPDGIVCIADKAFYDVEITELEFPASLKYIGWRAFAGGMRNDTQCIMKDTEIDFKNVEYIGNYAFEYAHYLYDLDLSNVTYLGDGAFYWSNHMKTVKLADEMEYLGSAPFGESDSITAITGPKFVKHAYYNSFYTGGSFGSSITDVNGDGYTVYNSILLTGRPMEGATGIVIPDGVVTVANRALDNFSGFTSITVPESVKGIAFSYNLHNITDVYYAGDKNGWNAIYMEDTTLNGTPALFANATIHCAKSSATDLADCTVKLSYTKTTYTGKEKKPTVTVTNAEGVKLVKGTDYTLNYTNNVNAGTATVTVTGQNDYCGTVEKTFTINQVDKDDLTISLEYDKIAINNKDNKPAVTVKNADGKNLVENTDYTVEYPEGSRVMGKYAVKVKLQGNYSGTKTLYFYITPIATSTVKTKLLTGSDGYNDVNVKWDSVTGAKGYNLYYKKSSASKWTKVDCGTSRSYTKNNLSAGTKYQFKVVAYMKDGSTKIESPKSKTDTIYTLKKVATPTVKKISSTKVKVSWKDISGDGGYQVQRMTKKGSTYVAVQTYTTKTSVCSKEFKPTKGKTYYYRVRAVKKEADNSSKTYGPWSAVKSYKLPK